MSVDISAEQLNASAANVSVDTVSEHENISSYLLEAIYDSNDLREIPDLIKVTISAEKVWSLLEVWRQTMLANVSLVGLGINGLFLLNLHKYNGCMEWLSS